MFRLSDDWRSSIRRLTTLSEDVVECISSTLKNLERKGFLKREQLFNENGKFSGVDYHIYEESQNVDNSLFGPYVENTDTLNKHAENCQLYNNKILNTKISNTNIKKERNTLNANSTTMKDDLHSMNKNNKTKNYQCVEENSKLKEVYQNYSKNQDDDRFKSIEQFNQRLNKVNQDCHTNCKEVEKNQTHYKNNIKPEIKNSRNSCPNYMSLYGRESFDEITAKRVPDLKSVLS